MVTKIHYSQKTKKPDFKRIKHGKLYSGLHELYTLFNYNKRRSKGKLQKAAERDYIIKHFRMKGETKLWTVYYPKTKTLRLDCLVFDSNLRNSESLRRTVKMIKQAEEDAKLLGAKKIETDFTLFSPKFLGRLGYKIKQTAKGRSGDKFYIYEKEL